MPNLRSQCDPRHELCQLEQRIDWRDLEEGFAHCYSALGRPAKPIRLMSGLLLLKQLYDVSDEEVVARWVENPYWQKFCGMEHFEWSLPCDPTDLVYFRQRIGAEGAKRLLQMSVQLHGSNALEQELVVDSTVQEKNITFPVDTKQYRKIIVRCWKLADAHGVKLRRRYGKQVRQCLQQLRWRKIADKRKLARRAQRRLRTIAGILLRELERKLSDEVVRARKQDFALYRRVLKQKPSDRAKIYSLHEPHVYCVAKGKEHKKYEFGTKASVAITKTHGIIVAAVAHEQNQYDGHTLPEVLEQARQLRGTEATHAIVDRGYRGRKWVGITEVLVPGGAPKDQSARKSALMRRRFRRRAAIEPVIGHLKADFRLGRCWLKAMAGDEINLLMAATAWNLRKWIRLVVLLWLRLITVSAFATPRIAQP